jgi:hypothetical protein
MNVCRLIATASTALAIATLSPATRADQLDAPTALSGHQGYAAQVAAECMRNRAYGLSTNGLLLKAYCDIEGNTAAMEAQYQSQSMTTYKSARSAPKGTLPSR